jgi:hypothetical protein
MMIKQSKNLDNDDVIISDGQYFRVHLGHVFDIFRGTYGAWFVESDSNGNQICFDRCCPFFVDFGLGTSTIEVIKEG